MEWPDHGVSEDPGIVLGLLNEIHLKHESVGKNAPIVVHCRFCLFKLFKIIKTNADVSKIYRIDSTKEDSHQLNVY